MSFSWIIRSRLSRRITGVMVALAALIVLPGCWVTSINPLYDDTVPKDRDVVFNSGLNGSWSITEDKCTTILTITGKDEIYDLRAEQGKECSDPGKNFRLQARLVRLDTSYFLDISPMPDDVCDMCVALHWIFLVQFDRDKLALTPIESKELNKLLQAGTVDLKTLPRKPNTSIFEPDMTLVALSKDLKNFCRRYAADGTVFNQESSRTFKRGQASEGTR